MEAISVGCHSLSPIIGSAGEWRIRQAVNVYATKEAAFEAAAASLALRQGHDLQITAPESELATGGRELE